MYVPDNNNCVFALILFAHPDPNANIMFYHFLQPVKQKYLIYLIYIDISLLLIHHCQ